MNSILKRFISAGLATGLILSFLAPQAEANKSETSLTVAQFTVSWPEIMYVPTGCSRFEFRYINNAPYEFLQVGFTVLDQFGDHIASDSLIGAPPGRTGIWDKQICLWAVSGGLGPYKMKVYIRDYDSRGGGTIEQYADLFFTARPGTTPVQPVVQVQPVVPEVTSSTGRKINTSTKKQTIVCVKGKSSRKVTSINPKCPAGFKKKK